jgi:hypothetical protein
MKLRAFFCLSMKNKPWYIQYRFIYSLQQLNNMYRFSLYNNNVLKLHHTLVLTEVTVTSGDTTEYLGMIGLFGFCISFAQSLVLEQDDIRKFFGNKENDDEDDTDIDIDSSVTMCSLPIGFILLFSFVGVTMLGYIGASRFLIISEAAFFSLSLLTGDLWSVVFSVVAERIVPQPLFFAALASVLSGVVLYEMAPSPAPEKGIKYGEDKNYTDNDGIIMLSQLENSNSTSN